MEKEIITKVFYLRMKENGAQRFFASLAAMYSAYNHEEIGITYQSLKNHFFKGNDKYENAICVIVKGILERKSKE